MIIEARGDTITIKGSIGKNIWPAIQAAAALLLREHPKGIILDGSAVEKCTKTGAHTFADAFNYIDSHDARIVVTGLSPEVVETVRAVPGVRSQLPIVDTVEDARSSIQLEETEKKRGKARQAGVVPILGDWRRAVFHASKLAQGENCELHLVDLIKVPLSLPLGNPVPEREGQGQTRLEEACVEVEKAHLSKYSHVERVRSYREGLSSFVHELPADFAVVSIDSPEPGTPVIEEYKAAALVEAADFEISLVKNSPKTCDSVPQNAVVPAAGDWAHALEHTCKLLIGEDSKITVVYLISVPRAQAIDAPMPDALAKAADCSKEASRIGRKYGVEVATQIERVRDPVLGFTKLFDEYHFDLAVVGVRSGVSPMDHLAREIASTLLNEPLAETVYLKVVD